ncbi:MAG: hypothetical protein R2827_08350 [Bdellovibrionales bacterium]
MNTEDYFKYIFTEFRDLFELNNYPLEPLVEKARKFNTGEVAFLSLYRHLEKDIIFSDTLGLIPQAENLRNNFNTAVTINSSQMLEEVFRNLNDYIAENEDDSIKLVIDLGDAGKHLASEHKTYCGN